MATGRMLRSQISVSTQVNDLSLKAALLFTWIIPHLDDFGRMTGDPRKIKAIVVPMRDDIKVDDIGSYLIEMYDQKLIYLYAVDGETYLQFTKFEKHQSGLHKRTSSKVPPPEAAPDKDSRNFPEIPGDSFPTELKRTELKRREEKENKKEKAAAPLLSGKPDDLSFLADQKTERLRQKAQRRSEAIEVLNFLNEKTKKRFRPVEANLKPIEARLASGVSVQDCRSIIALKYREWSSDEEFKKHINPITLFRPSNFEKYLGQLEVIDENEGDYDVR